MNKEKALKNQGLEFREDIERRGGKIENFIFPLSFLETCKKITEYRKFNINIAKKKPRYDCKKYIKTDNLYCENIRIDAKTGFLS